MITSQSIVAADESHAADIADMFWRAKAASGGKFLTELTSFEDVAAWLDHRLTCTFVAIDGDQVVGHVGLMEASEAAAVWGLEGQWTQVSRLCVDPEVRGRGLGVRLVETVLAAHMFATVQEGSASHHLFIRSGMTVAKSIVFPNNPAPGLLLVS